MPGPAPPVLIDRLAWADRQSGGAPISLLQGERLYVCGDGAAALLLAMAGFDSAASCRIVCEGRDLTGVATPSRHVAYIPGGDSVLLGRSLRANVMLPGATGSRADAALELLGLSAVARRPARGLTLAQRRLGALARALAADPALLLIEEAAADPPAIPDMLAGLDRPCAIMAGAGPAVALARAGRILLLRDGTAIQFGAPRDLYQRPADAGAALWSGPCNLIPARLDGAGARPGSVVARIGAMAMTARYRDAASGEVALAVRPGRLRLDPAGLPATLTAADYQGATTRLTLLTGGGVTLLLETADPPALSPGAVVGVTWDWSDAWPVLLP